MVGFPVHAGHQIFAAAKEAAEQAQKILGDWYKAQNQTLSPKGLGTAVIEAVRGAGGSPQDAAKQGAEAAAGAGASKVEIEEVRAAALFD